MFKRGSVAAVVACGLLLAVGGCGGGADGKADASQKDKAATRPPSKALVKWVGGMCESTAALKTVRRESAADLEEIKNPDKVGPPAEHLAVGYISRTPTGVEDVERELKELGPSGVSKADRLRDAWLKKLGKAVAELDGMSPGDGFEDAEGSAGDVDKQVRSLTPPDPDLPALTKKDPRLAAAHKRAKQCDPDWKPDKENETPAPASTGPLPKAADGKDTGACTDGKCEVLVASSASFTANNVSVNVTVSKESVTFTSAGTVMQLGGTGGVAEFGDDLRATIVAHNKDGAVLKFSIP